MKENTACGCGSTPAGKVDSGTAKRARGKLTIGLALALGAWIFLYSWLQRAAEYITYDVFNLSPSSHLGSSIAFFLYDAPKVMMLLVLIVFVVGIIRSFFTPERTQRILAGKKEAVGNVLAASLGIVTPFCSCSAVPLFIGFVEVGVPLGVTLSFLIAAPMINEVALVLLFGLFGWKVALLYVSTGLFIAILAGWVIGKLKMERFIEDWVFGLRKSEVHSQTHGLSITQRIRCGFTAVRDIVGRVWPWVLAGIAVGAVIHGYVPEGLMASIMGRDAWWAVPVAVLLGVPLYSNAAGIIPVVQALLEKGAALGTVLAFMMAVVGLSLPETIILRKVLRWRLIAVFLGVVAVGIIIIGYLFNAVL